MVGCDLGLRGGLELGFAWLVVIKGMHGGLLLRVCVVDCC